MFNLMKMYFYRLFHAKSFYILLGIAALLAFLTPYVEFLLMGFNAALNADPDADIDAVLAAMDITMTLPQLFGAVFPTLALLIGLGATFLSHAEDKNGYIKNIAGQISPRGIQAAAKLPVLVFEILAMFLITFLVFLGFALFKDEVCVGSIPDMFKITGIHLLLFLAFDALLMFLTFLTKKSAVGVFVSLAVTANISSLAYMLINYVSHKYLGLPAAFDISDYMLDTYIGGIAALSDGALAAKGLAVGAVYLIVCTLAAFFIIKKRDI